MKTKNMTTLHLKNQSPAHLGGAVIFSSSPRSAALGLRRLSKRLTHHQTEAIPATTPLRAKMLSSASQPAPTTRPPVLERFLATPPAATTRPTVLVRSKTTPPATSTPPTVALRS